MAREQSIFQELRDLTHRNLPILQEVAAAIAELDVYGSLSELSVLSVYGCDLELSEDSILKIEGGRHPVLDVTLPQGEFVPE